MNIVDIYTYFLVALVSYNTLSGPFFFGKEIKPFEYKVWLIETIFIGIPLLYILTN